MPGEIVLEMKDISKKFPGVLALDHANLEIKKGEVHILLGERSWKIYINQNIGRRLFQRFWIDFF